MLLQTFPYAWNAPELYENPQAASPFSFFYSLLAPYNHIEFRILSIPEADKDTFIG